jgi:multiple sugar transport system ATP-binding protein
MSFLQIKNLEKSFGGTRILKDVSLEIEEGGFLVLVGPSGCGKSTLLNTIAGLEPIDGGEIRIAGKDVAGLPPAKRDIAMVFQSYALYPNMTVAGNMAFGMEIRGVPKAERDAAVARVADMMQISHLLNRKPGALSGGQRQRVAMGRALVREPQIFLFDEPLSNLDAKLRIDMRSEIKRLHQRIKSTIIYVTHDQIEAMTLATRIAVLKDGVLQQIGAPADIYNNPVNMFVADFMGSPTMNLIPARLHGTGNKLAISLNRQSLQPLNLPLPSGAVADRLKAFVGRDIVFAIRPEALTDVEGADRTAQAIAYGDCLIDIIEPAGSDTFAHTNLGGKEVVARLRADCHAAAGGMAQLAFNLDKAVYFDPASQHRI